MSQSKIAKGFRAWLVTQEGHPGPIGHFVRDLLEDIRDGCMPSDCQSFKDISNHIYGEHGYCQEADEAQLEAWREYYSFRRPSTKRSSRANALDPLPQ